MLQHSLEIELELGVPGGTWSCPTAFQYHFHPAFFLVLNKLSLYDYLYIHIGI